MIEQILIPVDGNEHVAKAVEFAAQYAKQNDATIHFLHVVKQTKIPDELEDFVRTEKGKESPGAFYMNLMGNQFIREAETLAKEIGIKKLEKSIVSGDPAEGIIEYAKQHNIDMIIIASWELGTVSIRVLNETNQICVMVRKTPLEGKKILIVDDEPDVLETLEELLDICEVETASSFEEGKRLMETQEYDIAVLDIMGVNGYELLRISNERKTTAVMLTAHAFSVEDTERSYTGGAAFYVPKEKMDHVVTYLNDVLEAKERGKHSWWRWFERFGSYYEKKFGASWKTQG